MQKLEIPKLNSTAIYLAIVALTVIFFVVKNYYKPVPATLTLQVPFSAQAPTNNWARNEDCEETSITMANAFLTGSTEDHLPAEAAQNAINNLKIWEQANLGYNKDTGADATAKMAEGAFGLKIKRIQNFTANDLKKELAKGSPILLPINGKLLGNAQYQNEGPTYHMIVIRGYKNDVFIVNDPGTNGGNGNEYDFSTLYKASADWDNVNKQMVPTSKIALVVSK